MVQDFGASIAPEARGQRRDGFNAEMLAYRLMRRRSQHGCWAAGVIGENRRNGRNRNVMTVWSVHKAGPSQQRADEVQCGSIRRKNRNGPEGPFWYRWFAVLQRTDAGAAVCGFGVLLQHRQLRTVLATAHVQGHGVLAPPGTGSPVGARDAVLTQVGQ